MIGQIPRLNTPQAQKKILKHCDGKTLLTARRVNDEWRSMVDYLTQAGYWQENINHCYVQIL
ncbi:hypothetical protein NQ317_001436 [Molorchus minor]|uniref:F-box domain-containing protein n=1 Tax=Molorchus minor TaxID=1323400 RepID=A0ABQ9JYE3_9CUCU|nr:hypothetical protein NQ317_001436 [Molorchus minor]